MKLLTMPKRLRSADRALMSVFALLLMANLTAPMLSADCCKTCGIGSEDARTTRGDTSCFLGTCYTQCSTTSECGTYYNCPDSYNDNCNGYIGCGGNCQS